MKWTLCLAIAVLLIGATRLPAEQPMRTPDELKRDATHIMVGEIQQIYSTTSDDGNWKTTNSVAEIHVRTVERGERLVEGGLVYARFWNRRWVNKQQPTPLSASGHYAIEAKVDTTVRAFLRVNKEDNGFDVLLTNGIQAIDPNVIPNSN